ncbi:MAG: hypothetical protein NTX25_13650, partial [Proteobacteria bacterium]|nr:hypothetical protein [Pseudomonadota bacterium]
MNLDTLFSTRLLRIVLALDENAYQVGAIVATTPAGGANREMGLTVPICPLDVEPQHRSVPSMK